MRDFAATEGVGRLTRELPGAGQHCKLQDFMITSTPTSKVCPCSRLVTMNLGTCSVAESEECNQNETQFCNSEGFNLHSEGFPPLRDIVWCSTLHHMTVHQSRSALSLFAKPGSFEARDVSARLRAETAPALAGATGKIFHLKNIQYNLRVYSFQMESSVKRRQLQSRFKMANCAVIMRRAPALVCAVVLEECTIFVCFICFIKLRTALEPK